MRSDTREAIKVLAFMAALVIVAMFVLLVALKAMGAEGVPGEPTEAEWQEYESAAAKAPAGEVVPLPGEDSHAKRCTTIKGWCPTVTNGVIAGKEWCIGKKCGQSHVNRTLAIFEEFGGWIVAHAGGASPYAIAGTIRTESEGKVFAKTKSWTEECGLTSVDLFHAKELDVNACDPEAAIWAAGMNRNRQLLNLRAKYPQLALAPLDEQWKLAGAAGAVGSNKIISLIKLSNVLEMKIDGTLRWPEPHGRLLKWLISMDKSKQWDLYSWEWRPYLGPNPGKTAFRIARPAAAHILLGPLHPSGTMEFGEPIIPDRPEGILPFPGTDKHCQCWRWPELEGKRP